MRAPPSLAVLFSAPSQPLPGDTRVGARSSRILLLGSSSQHPAPLRAWTGLRGKPRPLCRGTPALRAPAIRPLPPGQAAPVWTVPRGCFAVFHNLPACRGDWEGLWEAGPPAMDRGRLLRGGKGDAKEDMFPPLPQLFPHRAAPTPTGWSLCLSAPASQAPCPRVVCWSSSQQSGKRFTRSRTRVL